MTSWFGIAIFLLFSLCVSLFSQLESKRFRRRELPADLGHWTPADGPRGNATVAVESTPNTLFERRVLLVRGTLFRRTRLVQQARCRDSVTGEVLRVEPEVTLARWFEGF